MIIHRERYGMNTKLQKFSRMKARTKKQKGELDKVVRPNNS